MQVKSLGHATFLLIEGKDRLLFDPWLEANTYLKAATGGKVPDDINPSLILTTHLHGDHFADAIPMAKKYNVPIVSTPEVARHCMGEGAKVVRIHLGGREFFPFGTVKAVQAFHSCPHAIGQTWRGEGGVPCAFVLEFHGKRFYFAGDTALMMDMQLWAPIDVAFLCIDGKMVMPPEDAVRAAEFLQAKVVIPMHWREEDPKAFIKLLESKTKAKGVLLQALETWDVPASL